MGHPSFFTRHSRVARPAFRAAGAYSEVVSGGGNATPSYGTNVAGDLFLAVGVGYLSDITPPSGWTQHADTYLGGGGSAQHGYVFSRDARSSGGETGTPSFLITDRGSVRVYSMKDVAISSFYQNLAYGESLSGAWTNPSGTWDDVSSVFIAFSGFSTGGSVTMGGTPSGGTWVLDTAAFGSGDIFFHHLQHAEGSGSISGGTTEATGADAGQYAAFRLYSQ